MKKLLVLLFLLPACSEMSVVADASVSDDAVLDDGSDALVITEDARVDPPDAPGADASFDGGLATLDAGSDAGVPVTTAVCGDGYIDPPETCDPAYVGGVHSNPLVCAAAAPEACVWCRWGLLPSGGCVYGDYLTEVRSAGFISACRDSASNDLSWVVWHSAAERDAILAAYRSVGAATDVSGWIGLMAIHDAAPFVWTDDNSEPTPDILLAFRNTRTTGRNCVTLTVTPTEAYLRYESCNATTVHGLCVTAPWGTRR